MPKSRIFNMANMSCNANLRNKILTKVSEFTVAVCVYHEEVFLDAYISHLS